MVQILAEDEIALRVAAQDEYLLTRRRETCLRVERDGPRVVFPHPKPEDVGSAGDGRILERRHERLRNARAVKALIDVEALNLGRLRAMYAGRGRVPAKLSITDECAVAFTDESSHRGILNIGRLVLDAVVGSTMKIQIFGAVSVCECVPKGPLGQFGKLGRIASVCSPNGCQCVVGWPFA